MGLEESGTGSALGTLAQEEPKKYVFKIWSLSIPMLILKPVFYNRSSYVKLCLHFFYGGLCVGDVSEKRQL